MANTMRKNTDARARGGAVHSSEETLVMRVERRDGVVQSSSVVNLQAGMSGATSTKPDVIAKRAVWEAYQQVKANRAYSKSARRPLDLTDPTRRIHPNKIAGTAY